MNIRFRGDVCPRWPPRQSPHFQSSDEVEKYFGPAEKINITVPALTLKRIDEYAVKHGESRSGFLVRAAEESMRKAG
jgi:HicB_like antitoxin of bacterial toxin-antitoxin system